MRTISFSVMKDKLLTQMKRQTIRRPRKQPLKEGERLQVYWKQHSPDGHRMGTLLITKITTKPFNSITSNEFIKDGFSTLIQGHEFFERMYPDLMGNTLFDVIEFLWTEDRAFATEDTV